MTSLDSRVGWICAFALIAAPPLAFADGSSARPSARDRPANAVPNASTLSDAPVPVDERFVRDLERNCQYVATIRGSVQRTPPEADAGVPDLSIGTRVHCRDGSAEHVAVRTLAGAPLGTAELTSALTEHASVVVYRDGRLCAYSPTFTFVEGRLAAGTVVQSCQPLSLGGGPLM